MNSNEIILKFVAFLAHVRAMFRQFHLFAEKSPVLHSVSTMVIPFKGDPSDYADDGVTVSIALNAEVRKVTDSEKKAVGMSLLLRHSGGLWIAEAEVGWTGEKVGWDPFASKEVQATSIEEIMNKIPSLVEWMGVRFRDEVEKLQNASP
jgi:hypothetical protein